MPGHRTTRQRSAAPNAIATGRQLVTTVRCRLRAASAAANRLVVDPASTISASPDSTSAAAAAAMRVRPRVDKTAEPDAGLVDQ
jgi:hypothetical protein